jgi:hypothetical protein
MRLKKEDQEIQIISSLALLFSGLLAGFACL